MPVNGEAISILMADDDPGDQRLVLKAFEKSRLANEIYFVSDGEQLLDYLHCRGSYTRREDCPIPGVILLDLNMPRLDGREALKLIKSDEELRHIPVVVLTTSMDEADVYRTYDLGANSFITKPVTFEGLVDVVRNLGLYWFEIVRLPVGPGG